jgi:dTDP-4-amino-4,6-dideoxygalactose transaminase
MTAPRSFIPVARPWLADEEAAAVAKTIASGWVTQGPEVAALEREFADWTGAPHACAVSSGTTALHLALLAAGVGPGDEVVTVSHSFIATANSIRYCGATPVFVDVEPGTYNMDPRLVAAALTPRTRAILCVHQLGMPCDLRAILPIARAHGLPLVEDAACAAGSEVDLGGGFERIGKPHGDIACFSFHPRKLVTTGDGGMITTGRAEWDARCRLWRQHGMSVSDQVRHGAARVIFESYGVLGYNYRLTDIQAAVGRVQLGRLPEVVRRHRALAGRYHALLAGVPGLGLPAEPAWAKSNWQSYCVRLPDGCDQRAVMQALLDRGIATRRAVMCAHREPAYADAPLRFRLDCSEAAQDRGILLPLYAQLAEADQDSVAAALAEACGARRGTAPPRGSAAS